MKNFQPFPASVRAVAEVEKFSLTNPELYIRLMGIVFTETYGDDIFGFFYDEEWRRAKADLGECLDLTRTKYDTDTMETAESIIKMDESSPGGRNMRFAIFDSDAQHPMVMAALKKMKPFSEGEKRRVEFLLDSFISSADISTLPFEMTSFIPNNVASNHLNVLIQSMSVLNPESGRLMEESREVISENNIDGLLKQLGPGVLQAFSDFFWLLTLENVRKNPELARIMFDYIGDDLSTKQPYIVDVVWGLLSDIERNVSKNYVRGLFETNSEFLAKLPESRKRVFMETLLAQNNTSLMKKMVELGVVEKSFEFAGGYELRELLDVSVPVRKSTVPKKSTNSGRSSVRPPVRQFAKKRNAGAEDTIIVPLKTSPKGPPKRAFKSQMK